MADRGKTRHQARDDLADRLEALRGTGVGPGRKKSRMIAYLSGLGLIVCVLGALYLIYTTATGPGDEGAGGPATITVVEGDTLSSVADKLRDAGVIESATAFTLEARLEGGSTEIKPGEYRFTPGQDGNEILAELVADRPGPTFALTVPEGLTLRQTAETVARQSSIPQEEFEAAARETGYGYAFLENPSIETTEGFLFPKRYEFAEGATASQVVNRMLEQYFIETQELDFAGARQNLNEYEILTVASLIEREAANAEERPLIASVIYNRLRDDMPLQIDATIQYARGKPKERLSLEDLEIDSPYNTYQNKGLPPGPICSPGLGSIRAALQPADTNHLYYVLERDGEAHFFTDDYEEFQKAKARAGL